MATPNQIQVSIISIWIVRQQNQHIVGLQKQPTEINKIQYKSQINNQKFSLKCVSASGGSMVICWHQKLTFVTTHLIGVLCIIYCDDDNVK